MKNNQKVQRERQENTKTKKARQQRGSVKSNKNRQQKEWKTQEHTMWNTKKRKQLSPVEQMQNGKTNRTQKRQAKLNISKIKPTWKTGNNKELTLNGKTRRKQWKT